MGSGSSKPFDPKSLARLDGKVAIVTGGRGLGKAIARYLLAQGAKVYILARNHSGTATSIASLFYEGFTDVHFLELDLVDPRAVRRSAEKFLKMENRLDILVNNAALLNDHGEVKLNDDGLSESMATNVLGQYVLTNALLPLLKATAAEPGSDVRIINIGTHGHTFVRDPKYATKEDWNQTFSHRPVPSQSRYIFSKMAFHLWSNGLVNRLNEDRDNKIIVVITHPGPIYSDGVQSALGTLPLSFLWNYITSFIFPSPEAAAHGTVFAAASPEVHERPDKYHGAYIKPPTIIGEQNPVALDRRRQDEVWRFMEGFLNELEVER